jgi:hypothetical protein
VLEGRDLGGGGRERERGEEGREGRGEQRGRSKCNGEIEEGRRSAVCHFVPSKVLVDFDFLPLIRVGITRTHEDAHSAQHVLQLGTTRATGDVAEEPAKEASKSTRTVDCPCARVVAGRHVLLAHLRRTEAPPVGCGM